MGPGAEVQRTGVGGEQGMEKEGTEREGYRVDDVASDGTGTLVLVAPETSKRTFQRPGYCWSLLASRYVSSSAGTSYDRRTCPRRARQGCGGEHAGVGRGFWARWLLNGPGKVPTLLLPHGGIVEEGP